MKLIQNKFMLVFTVIIEVETRTKKIAVENLETSKNASSDLQGVLMPKLENLSRPQSTTSRQMETSVFTWSSPFYQQKTVGIKSEGLQIMMFVCAFPQYTSLMSLLQELAGSEFVKHLQSQSQFSLQTTTQYKSCIFPQKAGKFCQLLESISKCFCPVC